MASLFSEHISPKIFLGNPGLLEASLWVEPVSTQSPRMSQGWALTFRCVCTISHLHQYLTQVWALREPCKYWFT